MPPVAVDPALGLIGQGIGTAEKTADAVFEHGQHQGFGADQRAGAVSDRDRTELGDIQVVIPPCVTGAWDGAGPGCHHISSFETLRCPQHTASASRSAGTPKCDARILLLGCSRPPIYCRLAAKSPLTW